MNLTHYRRQQDRTVAAAITAFCGLGLAGALSPAVEHAITTALALVGALALLVAAARWVTRRLRERREDRADALAAAVWRARHLPHLAAQLGEQDRAGVA